MQLTRNVGTVQVCSVKMQLMLSVGTVQVCSVKMQLMLSVGTVQDGEEWVRCQRCLKWTHTLGANHWKRLFCV